MEVKDKIIKLKARMDQKVSKLHASMNEATTERYKLRTSFDQARLPTEQQLKAIDINSADIARINDLIDQMAEASDALSGQLDKARIDVNELTHGQTIRTLKQRADMTQTDLNAVDFKVRKLQAIAEGQQAGFADAAIQKGGNPRAKGKIVKRGVPRFLDPDPKLNIPPGSSGRLQLARWMTRPSNPLTARVMVNRIWQQHFGKPIVATPSDFGMQGEA